MKMNHMICPSCGHDFFTDCAYATCDSCHCMFYASQSLTNKQNAAGFAFPTYKVRPIKRKPNMTLCEDWEAE